MTLCPLGRPDPCSLQVRYHVKGWDLEAAHEFGQAGTQLGLAKHFNYATIRGSWHTGSKEAALQYKRR